MPSNDARGTTYRINWGRAPAQQRPVDAKEIRFVFQTRFVEVPSAETPFGLFERNGRHPLTLHDLSSCYCFVR
jgi:hypothetical protein